MHIEPHTGTVLIIAFLLALEVIGLGAWGLKYGCGRRRGRG